MRHAAPLLALLIALPSAAPALAGPGPVEDGTTLLVTVDIPKGDRYGAATFGVPTCGSEVFVVTDIAVMPKFNPFAPTTDFGRWTLQTAAHHWVGGTSTITGLSLAGEDEVHATLSLPSGVELAKVYGYVTSSQLLISLRDALPAFDTSFTVAISGSCGTAPGAPAAVKIGR